MPTHCYSFGAAIANIRGEKFDIRDVIEAGRAIGLSSAFGSVGEREAMIGAFDEYKRLIEIDKEAA